MMVEKMLIVDDQGQIRNMLKLALGYGKYVMYEAETGEEAMATFAATQPDVVLLDVMLPGNVDGFEVCQWMRKKTEGLVNKPYIVLITAKQQNSDIDAGRKAGADVYVIKPFSPINLIEVIESRSEHIGPMRVVRKPN